MSRSGSTLSLIIRFSVEFPHFSMIVRANIIMHKSRWLPSSSCNEQRAESLVSDSAYCTSSNFPFRSRSQQRSRWYSLPETDQHKERGSRPALLIRMLPNPSFYWAAEVTNDVCLRRSVNLSGRFLYLNKFLLMYAIPEFWEWTHYRTECVVYGRKLATGILRKIRVRREQATAHLFDDDLFQFSSPWQWKNIFIIIY